MEHFNFERLAVRQKAVNFADNIIDMLDKIELSRNHFRLFEQIASACTNISMNAADHFQKQEMA